MRKSQAQLKVEGNYRFAPPAPFGLRNVDPTGTNNVHYLVGTHGLTVSLFATDRKGTWHYVGLYYDEPVKNDAGETEYKSVFHRA